MTGGEHLEFYAVIVGPFVGSFIATAVDRAAADRSFVFGRSSCAGCGKPLAARDLVPIVSWALLRGRCRYCRAAIPTRYAATEVAALAVAAWAAITVPAELCWVACVLGWALLALLIFDLRLLVLPDALTLPLIPAGLATVLVDTGEPMLVRAAAAALAASGAVLLRYAHHRLRGREGLGIGDVKLLAAAGAWVGLEMLPHALMIASALGLVAALVLVPARRLLVQPLPFGACLAVGLWIVWLYQPLREP